MLKSKIAIALQILTHMNKTAGFVTVLDLATELRCSGSYVETVISVLSKARLVEGKRGPGGGYVLTLNEDGWYVYSTTPLRHLAEMLYDQDSGGDMLSPVFADMPLRKVLN